MRTMGDPAWDVGSRECLVQSLEAQLYSEFYCRGRAAPERPLSPVVAASADVAAFVRELSDANHGHGRWDDGWTLSSWDDDTAVVTRDGVRLWVADDELRHLTAGRPGIGEQVAVRHPKDSSVSLPASIWPPETRVAQGPTAAPWSASTGTCRRPGPWTS